MCCSCKVCVWQQYFTPPVCVRHGGLAGSGAVKGSGVSL